MSIAAIGVQHLSAGVLTNGDFSATADFDGFDPPISSAITEQDGNFALFDDTTITFLGMESLKQTFDLPLVPSRLTFDFSYSTEGSAASVFSDAFSVKLETTLDGEVMDILTVNSTGIATSGSGSTVPTAVTVDTGYSVTGFNDLPSATANFSGRASVNLPLQVLGDTATIEFTIANSDFAATKAAVDNITLTSLAAVPEPTSFACWATMLAGGLMLRRRKR